MDSVKVSGGGDLMSQIKSMMDATEIEVLQSANAAAKVAANQAVKTLKSTSPKGKNSRYAKGWKARKEDEGYIVYNESQPSLTHLLNNGHDVVDRNGRKVGRYAGDNHIGKAEQEVGKFFVEETERELNRRLGS